MVPSPVFSLFPTPPFAHSSQPSFSPLSLSHPSPRASSCSFLSLSVPSLLSPSLLSCLTSRQPHCLAALPAFAAAIAKASFSLTVFVVVIVAFVAAYCAFALASEAFPELPSYCFLHREGTRIPRDRLWPRERLQTDQHASESEPICPSEPASVCAAFLRLSSSTGKR